MTHERGDETEGEVIPYAGGGEGDKRKPLNDLGPMMNIARPSCALSLPRQFAMHITCTSKTIVSCNKLPSRLSLAHFAQTILILNSHNCNFTPMCTAPQVTEVPTECNSKGSRPVLQASDWAAVHHGVDCLPPQAQELFAYKTNETKLPSTRRPSWLLQPSRELLIFL